jgi:probable rRNA maturation factor
MPKFEINNLTSVRVQKKFLKRIANKTFKILDFKKLKEISLAIVGGSKIRSLNKKYRRKDRITDVLTFNYEDIGEIFICLSQAKKQAKQINVSLKEEIASLLIHGILHLAGYNDVNQKDYDKMIKEQKKILKKLSINK